MEYSGSEEGTLEIGRKLGRQLRPPCGVLLYGELGAGKTVLTRGLAQGLGVQDPDLIRSPTFTLVNEYPGREGIVYHVDLYRLEGLRDLYSIGLDEILGGHSVVIVEWAEKLLLPVENPIKIRISVEFETDRRRFEIEGI